jgi:hypothetical protein
MAETSSVFTDQQKRIVDKELREIVFQPNQYPEIVFRSTQVSGKKLSADQYDLNITGNLTLQGVTRPMAHHDSDEGHPGWPRPSGSWRILDRSQRFQGEGDISRAWIGSPAGQNQVYLGHCWPSRLVNKGSLLFVGAFSHIASWAKA